MIKRDEVFNKTFLSEGNANSIIVTHLPRRDRRQNMNGNENERVRGRSKRKEQEGGYSKKGEYSKRDSVVTERVHQRKMR